MIDVLDLLAPPNLGNDGIERFRVTGERFSVDKWYEQLRDNRTFVTNGPMLEFSVNGQGMGSRIELSPGDTIEITASARMNADIEMLDRIELIAHGETIAVQTDVAQDNSLSLDQEFHVSGGVWLAVRAYGRDQALAHSAPVFISVGGGFEKADAVGNIARKMLSYLDEFDAVQADPVSELEGWSVGGSLETMLIEQRIQILERADAARKVYAAMLDRAPMAN